MQRVRLRLGFSWVCPCCDAGNISELVPAEFDNPEEREEAYRELHDLEDWAPLPDDWEDAPISVHPQFVVCWSCENEFETTLEGQEDEDGPDSTP